MLAYSDRDPGCYGWSRLPGRSPVVCCPGTLSLCCFLVQAYNIIDIRIKILRLFDRETNWLVRAPNSHTV